MAEGDQPNSAVKHPLQNRWTFWYKQPQGGRNADWSKTLVKIVDIDTVEDFWALINNVKDPAGLNNNSSYMLFKSSSMPEWEHPDNANGYKVEIPIPAKVQITAKLVNDIWEELLMILIGEQLGNASEFINGAWVNIRAKGNRFEIWIKQSLPVEALREMSTTLKAFLTEAPSLATAAGAFKLTCTIILSGDLLHRVQVDPGHSKTFFLLLVSLMNYILLGFR